MRLMPVKPHESGDVEASMMRRYSRRVDVRYDAARLALSPLLFVAPRNELKDCRKQMFD